MFAAEASGRPGFIVPGLIAAMVSQLFMGSASASTYQMAARAGQLERRFSLPLRSVLRTDAATAAPDMTLDEFFREHAVGLREPATVVVEEGRYLGVIRVEELAETPQERWASTPVSDLMRMDFPTANPRWKLRDGKICKGSCRVNMVSGGTESRGQIELRAASRAPSLFLGATGRQLESGLARVANQGKRHGRLLASSADGIARLAV